MSLTELESWFKSLPLSGPDMVDQFESRLIETFGAEFYQVLTPKEERRISTESLFLRQSQTLERSTLLKQFSGILKTEIDADLDLEEMLSLVHEKNEEGYLRSLLLKRLMDTESGLPLYRGTEGLLAYSDRYLIGCLSAIQSMAKKHLPAKIFKSLAWPKSFPGSTTEFRSLREKILGSDKGQSYQGQEGYARFSDREEFSGAMLKAYKQVSAVLSKVEFEKLGWQYFPGTTTEFRSLREKILGSDEGQSYQGQEGYARFSDREEFSGAMQKAYSQVSAVLSKAEFDKLGWQQFPGTTTEFCSLRDKILGIDEGQSYQGQKGYARFSDREEFSGAMAKAFSQVSAVLSEAEFEKLGWQSFPGATTEFRSLREKILGIDEGQSYQGQKGYAHFSDREEFKGAMLKAYKQVSAVLSEAEFEKLGWQSFPGATTEFRSLRDKILGSDEGQSYQGQEGYARFSDREEFSGAMLKAYVQVSAVLSKAEFDKLGWQSFPGSTTEFRNLRDLVTKDMDSFKGEQGFRRLLRLVSRRTDVAIVKQVNGAFTEGELKELDWNRKLPGFLKSIKAGGCDSVFGS